MKTRKSIKKAIVVAIMALGLLTPIAAAQIGSQPQPQPTKVAWGGWCTGCMAVPAPTVVIDLPQP